MTSACFHGNGLTLVRIHRSIKIKTAEKSDTKKAKETSGEPGDLSMSQQLMASGHHCSTSKYHHVTPQTNRKIIETTVKSGTPIHATGGKSPTEVKGRKKKSDYQLRKNCDTEKVKTKKSGLVLMTYSRQPMSSLLSQCKRLEEENVAMLRQIVKMEDEAMKSASQQLQQYDRAGSNVRAVQIWTEQQIQDAQQDLELTKDRREKDVNELHLQLQNCEQKIQDAQKDLQQLREYRDCGHSVKVLQAAELERQLCVLSELHQDQAADVEALAQTEIEKLLESYQKIKDDMLQGVVEQHVEALPLSLKRMCLQNQEMRSEITAYQQMITGFQDDIKKLLETGDSLRKSWNKETDRLHKALLLSRPCCSANEDVVLDIPLNRPMYI
ncbi:uncharacterized protein C20orf96 homolog isoform X2 [Hyla sarda]|uniref:uncharacterized protein C20orf96 homolog isoform X2 n=1 Tax=Hyla sarda TaxID=327740 RepID=UPI0024C31728|nr:uncharacterized protein C20orf96 homolog isoform X2 [Hyla sarda]